MTALASTDIEEPGRLQRRKARTRTAILEAADRLFHSQGFEPTTIAQIAESADTGVGTVYGYFQSKDDVLRVVLRHHSDIALQRYSESVDSTTPAIDRVLLALSVFAAFLRDNRAILLATIQSSPARLRREGAENPMQWLVRVFSNLLAEGMSAGELRQLPVDTTARALISLHLTALLGIGVWGDRQVDSPIEEELETIARAMLAGR